MVTDHIVRHTHIYDYISVATDCMNVTFVGFSFLIIDHLDYVV